MLAKHRLTSPLTILTVGKLHKPTVKIIAKSKILDIDLSEVKNIDSAGVAFLLDLKSIAKSTNSTLSFSNTPDIIERFCQLYKVSL